MSYMTVLVCVFLSVISVVLFLIIKRRADAGFLMSVCLLVFILETITFALCPIPSYYYDSVQIKALNKKNDQAIKSEVFLESLSVGEVATSFPEVMDGKWFWLNGIYCWRPASDSRQPEGCTESIVLKIPVGTERELIFHGNKWSGFVEISYDKQNDVIDLYSENSTQIRAVIHDSANRLILKNELARILTFFIIHFVIFAGAIVISKLYLHRFLLLVGYCKYEVTFFVVSMIIVIKYGLFPNNLAFASSFYVNNYDFGFVKRGLLGEIVTTISPYVSGDSLAYFKLVFSVTFYFLLSILLGRLVRHQRDEKIRWFFVLMICSFPSTYIFIPDTLRPDIYLICLFIICTIFVSKDILLWIVPILFSIILLINETSCMYIIPPVLAMLVYKFVKYKEKKYIITAVIGSLFVVFLSCIFLFRENPRLHYDDSQIVVHLQNHAGFPINYTAIAAETWTISQQIQNTATHMSLHYRTTAIFFLFLIPAFLLMGILWWTLYKKWDLRQLRTGLQKYSVWLLAMSGLPAFVVMIISVDYPRYCSFLLSTLIISAFFFIYEENVQLQFSMDLRIRKTESTILNVLPIAICIFYLLFGMFGSSSSGTLMAVKMDDFLSALLGT